ncbi:hypothetical protein C0Q70_08032 [Pomacea canaliculata]|uniref:Uncharacterized protein n=2 Tax=Pomacea canaliculata TaxID=400727 RepID=A0A2T7PGS1_POMCA|nr:hypothetical protein C0Q70_08032 [Pomacea canaliculata]
MEKLLDVLARKDDMAFDDVLAVLQSHCQWLADEIEHQVSEEEKRWTKHDIRTKLSQALRASRIPDKQKDNIIERLTEVVEKEIAKSKRGSVLNHKMEAQMNTVTKKIQLLILKDVNPLIYGSVDTDLPTTDDDQDAIEALRNKLDSLKVLQKCYEAMNITYRRGGDTLPVLLMQKIDEVQAIVENNKLGREGEHRELQELNKKNKELERELIRLKELEGENKRLGNLRKQAKKAVRTLKDENLTMEKNKMKTDEENERLQSQLQIMEDRMLILIKGNDNLNIQNSKLQRDNQKLSATIAQLRLESGTNYISFVDRLKSVNKTIINENLRLRTKYNKLEESKRQKNIRLQKVLVENEFLRQQIQKLKRIGAHNSTTR